VTGPAPLSWRARIFGVSWLSYFSYYFTRQNYSIVKSSLGLGAWQLGLLETFYNSGYCAGQFINGWLAERVGPRRLLGTGMILSAIMAALFGLSDTLPVFILLWGGNGLLQASGWPGNARAMASWFSSRERGQVMGWWSTCYQFGPLAAGWFATWCMQVTGTWRTAMWAPAGWTAVVGIGCLLWMRDRPGELGFREPGRTSHGDPAAERELRRRALPAVVRNPMTWFLGANYFFTKLMRYSLLFWLPWYYKEFYGYDKVTSGYLATSFALGGVVGVVVAGLAADHLAGRRRIAVAFVMTVMLAGALWLYVALDPSTFTGQYLAMLLIGALLFGPDSIVSGAAAQDLGGPYAAAVAAGMVNGLGSIGQIAQGFYNPWVTGRWGYDALMTTFIVMAGLSALALLPFFRVRAAPAEV
jgi:sugar phosphate permease